MSGQSPITGSLFAPFFFPLGIAFMGAQSAVMMKMAGENWQYGKRRISAMTNEEFNAMTPLKLYQLETSELQAIIPHIEESLRSMTPLTATIVTEMINTFKVGAQATGAYLQDIIDTPLGNIIKSAIVVWMPWLIPLMEHIPDLSLPPPDEPILPPDLDVPPPPHVHTPGKHGHKTQAQIDKDKEDTQKEIDKQHGATKMGEYTTFLNEIVHINKRIMVQVNRIKQHTTNAATKKLLVTKILALQKIKKQLLLAFSNWKKNNRAWLINNNLPL